MLTLSKAPSVSPFRSNSKVSRLKVEKVLNPPQNPMAIKGLNSGEEVGFLAKKAVIKPKTRQLRKLAKIVPVGNKVVVILYLDKANRHKLPKPPPMKIAIY